MSPPRQRQLTEEAERLAQGHQPAIGLRTTPAGGRQGRELDAWRGSSRAAARGDWDSANGSLQRSHRASVGAIALLDALTNAILTSDGEAPALRSRAHRAAVRALLEPSWRLALPLIVVLRPEAVTAIRKCSNPGHPRQAPRPGQLLLWEVLAFLYIAGDIDSSVD